MTTAYESFRATAETPNGRLSATIQSVDLVTVSIDPSYFNSTSPQQLEQQLATLAKLLFVERMREYYRARSQDFSEPVMREASPVTTEDHEYVDRRNEIQVVGGSEGSVEVVSTGMQEWSVNINREWFANVDNGSFCAAAGQAASELVRAQFAQVGQLKREIYA
jgi:hypothetical protein